MVAGVQDSPDPNHKIEIYYGPIEDKTLDAMAFDLGIIIYPEDKTSVFPDPKLGLGSKIYIERALPVEVTDAKVTKIYRTWESQISDLLKENKLELLGQDSVEPNASTWLRPDMSIKITRVAEVEVTETESIDYKVIKQTSVDLEKGQTSVDTKGEKGQRDVVYKVKRVDGVEVSREEISDNVTKKPVTEIVIIGIGPKLVKSGPYMDAINNAAKRFLINGTALRCLMMSESGGSADAGYPDGQYQGLFQYDSGFWADIGSGSIWDGPSQINTTAWALTHGYGGRWPPWGRCSGQ